MPQKPTEKNAELPRLFQLMSFAPAFNLCGVPDGPFRSLVFPMSVHNLRHAREWLQSLIAERPFPYPVAAKAMLISQSINYVEGKAPEWTRDEGQVILR